MPRKRRSSKGKTAGLSGDVSNTSPGSSEAVPAPSGGGGKSGSALSQSYPRPANEPMLGVEKTFTFADRQYGGRTANDDQVKVQARLIVESVVFSPFSVLETNDGTLPGYSDIISNEFWLSRLDGFMWDTLYQELIYKLESRDGQRFTPTSIDYPKIFGDYVNNYIILVANLIAAISFQKIAERDDAHRNIGRIGMANWTRSRLSSLLERVTSLPVPPAYHAIAVTLGTPLWNGVTQEPVYHPLPRLPVHWQAQRVAPVSSVETLFKLSPEPPLTQGGNTHTKGVFDPNNATSWQGWRDRCEQLEVWLTNAVTRLCGTSWSSKLNAVGWSTAWEGYREDWRIMRELFRIMKVPSSRMSYQDVSPLRNDPHMYDQIMYRGALLIDSEEEVSSTETYFPYSVPKPHDGQVHLRGYGSPTSAEFLGLGIATASYTPVANDAPVLTGGAMIPTGDRGDGTLHTNRTQRAINVDLSARIRSTGRDVDAVSNLAQSYLARHDWGHVIGSKDPSNDEVSEFVPRNAADYDVLVPIDDIYRNLYIWHANQWGVPHIA